MLNLISSAALQSRQSGIPIKDPNGTPASESQIQEEKGSDAYTKGMEAIAGGGNQVRNITVNIAKLIESQNINTTNLTEGSPQIQQKVEEALIRAISGTEQMISQ